MKPRLPAAERRQQLLDVALETFSKQGYTQTSMNDIAEAAGVTKPVLYQHFGSKQALFLELLRELGGQLREEVAKAVAMATTPRQQVERGMRAYFTWVAANREGFEILFSGDTTHHAEFLVEALKAEAEIADGIASLIVVPGLDEERQRLLAYGVVGLAERACRYWVHRHYDMPADELAGQVADLVWSGLRGVQGAPPAGPALPPAVSTPRAAPVAPPA